MVKSGGIVVDAVAGTENKADLGTKILDRKKLVTSRTACGLVVTDEPCEEDLVSAVQPRGSKMIAAGGVCVAGVGVADERDSDRREAGDKTKRCEEQ